MSKLSFQSVVKSVMSFMIAGFLGVLYAYFVSGQRSNATLMRNFVETAFVFFPSVRTGMLMMHDGEGASTFLTLAFFTNRRLTLVTLVMRYRCPFSYAENRGFSHII